MVAKSFYEVKEAVVREFCFYEVNEAVGDEFCFYTVILVFCGQI